MDKLGNININGYNLNPKVDKKSFLISNNSKLLPHDKTTNVFIYENKINIDNMDFWILIGFNENNVSYIELENANEELKNNYSNWSNYKAKVKKQSHDDWLIRLMGEPTIRKENELIYSFDWGRITSYIDMKSGGVAIIVRFK